MKVAILSDAHDNAHNLILALSKSRALGAQRILFLGDFMHGGIAKILAANPLPVNAIRGNNDGSLVEMTKTAHKPGSNLALSSNEHLILTIENRRIFLTHYPDIAHPVAKSGEFEAVFYGHDHKKYQEMIGNCLLLNPGEISAHKTGIATFAIWDTESNTAQIVEIEGSITLKTALVDEHLASLPSQFGPRKD